MIPGTLSSETHVTQIEIQNEIKTTKIEKSGNNSSTSVKLLRQENPKECNNDAKEMRVINQDTAVANVQECGKLFTAKNVYKMEIEDINVKKMGKPKRKKLVLFSKSKKSSFYPTEYRVLIMQPLQSDEPMDYSPDRNSFVAKVLFLTFVMLSITAAFVAYVCISDEMRAFLLDTQAGNIMVMCGIGGMVILNYAVMCCPYMRMFPCNFVTLIIAVICMSLIAAHVTASYNTHVVALALVATAVTVLVCLLLACTSFDFTQYLLYIFAVGIAFSVLTLIVIASTTLLGMRFQIVHLILLFIGTLINIVVLIMELQMILGGKTVSLSENEYAMGAFMLYTSIIDLFLKLLQILGIFMEDGDELF